MRSKYLEVTSVVLLLSLIVIAGTAHLAQAAEQDFDDDGIVEDDDVSEPNAAEDNFEEIKYESPQFDPKQFYFVDHFDDIAESSKRWIKSEAKKDDIAEEIAKYDGKWNWEAPQRIVWGNDMGLVLKSNAKHAAISAPLSKIFSFKEEKPLVVQYEVTMQDGQECGGSYIKLLSEGKATEDLTKFNDKTPYTIMFGPDKCGNDYKMHFIFRHVNPINGSISEKHCRKPKERLEEPFKDKLPHLYTLIVKPDNTYEIRVDHKTINEGSLLTEFTPPVNPPSEIDDPEDIKPEDWDEREKIPDPTAVKPEDWDDDAPPQIPDITAVRPDGWLEDEPEMIPDTTAVKPEDWDAEIDGEWEAPMMDNPVCDKVAGCGQWKAPLVPNKEYKGKWRAPLIDNPNYQGKWAARKIPNPHFFEDLAPFKMTPIAAVGIELWSMSSDILFDNLIITDELAVAIDFAAKTYDLKRKHIDKESETFLNKVMSYFTENPWAWRIAIVLIGTPLVFSVYRLFSSSSSKESTAADPKKTDAEQEDDVAVSSGDVKNNTQNNSSPKKKKSDLDIKEDDGPGEMNVETVEDAVDDEASDEKESDEAAAENDIVQEEEVEVKPEGVEETTTKSAARKRRVRKDQS